MKRIPQTARPTVGRSRLPTLLLPALLVLLPMTPRGADAQLAVDDDVVDKVVAIVGDSAILLSQVLQQENRDRAGGLPVPLLGSPDLDDYRAGILQGLVNQLLLLQAAARDTLLQVDDAEVEEALQAQMASVEANYASRAAMEQDLQREGMTVQNFREMLRTQIGQGMLVDLYVGTRVANEAVELSDEEVRAFYDEAGPNIQEWPATVVFRQLVLHVEPSDSAHAATRALLEDLRDRALAGEDFAALARQYSVDPGTAESGGDLGWFRRGMWVDEFDEAAFSLLEGGISNVIETEFGYHIILVEQMRHSERKGRHILIRPMPGSAERIPVRALAEELAERAGTEGIEPLIEEHHDTILPDSAVVIEAQIATQLPPAYLAPLTIGEIGEIQPPIQFITSRGAEVFAIIKVLERRDAGLPAFEDIEQEIRLRLARQKRVETHLAYLRARTYIDIKGS